jgi:predicted methyltransferase
MRPHPIRSARLAFTVALAAALAACAAGMTMEGTLSSRAITQLVAAPDRTAADRSNDLRRKPDQMLAFIGVHPGIKAIDLSTGGGYTTELLARAIGPEGTVFAQSRPRPPDAGGPAAPEGAAGIPAELRPVVPARPRTSADAIAERTQRLQQARIAAAPIVFVQQPFEDPVPAAVADGGLDLATLMFNYHDLGWMGVDRAAMNRAVFRALKPGGLYVVADHAGRPGTGIGESGTLHRVEEALVRSEIEAAGFRLVAAGQFLRNPADPRDQNTPNPPQPKDEFVLKFAKP